MNELGVLQGGDLRRGKRGGSRPSRHHRLRDAGLLLIVGVVALLAFMASGVRGPGIPHPTSLTHARLRPQSSYVLTPSSTHVDADFKTPPRAGLLFDVRTGKVLWEHNPDATLPIASLTKMMTALVVAEHSKPSDRVLITEQAVHFTGSGVGLLPLGKRVRELPLLYGLLLPSGNDAAIALAQHVAGTQARFIGMMNAQARAMGLRCTHFSTVSGVIDRGNYSCVTDLAVIAHAVLEQPLLRRIVASPSAVLPFPIKHGKLFLYNNNPLMYLGYPGVDGVKTGYTLAAGQCLVAAARRGRAWYAAVLLNSVNTGDQAEKLLNRAFAS